ncbi:MAG: hypothetical protein QNJ47_28220 [Nostocaceae cyanobacterium]|nr:hypothetical protein [Nostocaceae cyanobacterium]
MYSLAIHEKSVSPTQLQREMGNEISSTKLLDALESLIWRSLIETHTAGFTLQPWVLESIKEKLTQVSTVENV